MKKIYKTLCLLVMVFSLIAAPLANIGLLTNVLADTNLYDFNDTTLIDLRSDYFRATGDSYFYSPGGGLDNSGVIYAYEMDSVWTTRYVYEREPEDTITVSGYFFNIGAVGYGGIGVSTNYYNYLGGTSEVPSTENGFGFFFHGSGGGLVVDGDQTEFSWGDGIELAEEWIFAEMTIEPAAIPVDDNEFDIT